MTTTQEKNLSHDSKINNERIEALIENNMQALNHIQVILLEIADRTSDSELESACALFYDDIMPVLREYVR